MAGSDGGGMGKETRTLARLLRGAWSRLGFWADLRSLEPVVTLVPVALPCLPVPRVPGMYRRHVSGWRWHAVGKGGAPRS
jgi:hypothetical protein